jgi:ABC-type nickel/cobalt efflux system permease component RcnA
VASTGLAAGIVLLPAHAAAAHPLGSFTVNTASVLRVQPDHVLVDVVVDMAEIPATQAKPDVETTGPARWRDRECDRLRGRATLIVNGRPRPLAATTSALTFPPGAGGLTTLRLVCRYTTDADGTASATAAVGYELRAYADRIGWREIVALGDRTTLVAGDAPARSPSGLLTSYPADPLSSPSDVTRASLAARPGGPPAADPLAAEFGSGGEDDGSAAAGSNAAGSNGAGSSPGADGLTARFTGLVGDEPMSWGIGLVALVAAILLGTAHAFAPGHGKTVMAARIAGGSASGRQLAAMALAVTLTHTLGVLLLAVGLSASSGFTPERLYPWLGAASGLLLVGLGANLLRTRLASLPRRRRPSLLGLSLLGEGHSHGHDSHDHHPSHYPSHADGRSEGHHHHDHSDGGHRDHSDGGHRRPGRSHAHGRLPGSAVEHSHGHSHGGRWHTHSFGSFGEKPPRLRDLLAVGFAGGMVPTPSAVVVLLGAVALGRAWFGVVLVLAYGAGMAATLVGIGYLLDRALQPMLRKVHAVSPNLASLSLRWVPVASAGVIVLVGAFLVLHAGVQVTT